MAKKKKIEEEIIEKVRGKNLDTPICKVRVFHIEDPSYTFEFVREEGDQVILVDDNNEEAKDGGKKLTIFPANDLVNVVVFRMALLDSETKIVSGK
jgi:hypothetical protein